MRKQENKNRYNNKGAAMMLTIIIIAVVMIFVFSLIIISYNLYASQTKNMSGLRNAEAVNTLSLAIEEELTDDNAIKNSNLWKYLRMNVAYDNEGDSDWKDWPYYVENDQTGKHGADSAYRYFKLENNDNMQGMPAEMNLCVYWTIPSKTDGAPTQAEIDSFIQDISSGEQYARNKVRLHVRTEATTGSQTYVTEDVYELLIADTDTLDKTLLKEIRKSSVSNPAQKNINSQEKWIWIHRERK